MTVVKFSVLALIAGGFCTLLGVGIWMGPQETACSAQTSEAAAVAVECRGAAATVAPCKGADAIAACCKEAAVAKSTCSGGGPCSTLANSDASCGTAGCAIGTCEGASGPVSFADACEENCPTSFAGVPAPSCAPPCATGGPCENGVCFGPPSPYPTALPGSPVPVAPWQGPNVPPTVYAQPYASVPHAYVASAYPADVNVAYAEARSPNFTYEDALNAIFEAREASFEAKVEALESQAEVQLEAQQAVVEAQVAAQEAVLKAQHEAEIVKLKAEATVKIASLEQALREEKALLHLVADGTISTQALQALLARNHANATGAAHYVSVPPPPTTPAASTSADCKCGKCGCEKCKCGTDAACKCTTCKCESCACPGCDKTVAISTKACPTGDCKPCGDACSTAAASCESCKPCAPCAKECGDCTLSGKTGNLIGVDFDFDVACDGTGCRIVVEGKPLGCRDLTVQRTEFRCPCESEKAATEASSDPFVCEKDGCELTLDAVEGVPILSKIPYISRLFENQGQVLPSPYYLQDDVQYVPTGDETKAQPK